VILLADARHRAGGSPGLTTSNSRLLGREGEVSALCIGTYFFCGHSVNEVMSAVLGPLLLDQPPKSKPVTPSWVVTSHDTRGPAAGLTSINPEKSAEIPHICAECPMGCPQSADPTGHPPEGDEMPPRALAVAEMCARGGLTGRVGAGPKTGPPPR